MVLGGLYSARSPEQHQSQVALFRRMLRGFNNLNLSNVTDQQVSAVRDMRERDKYDLLGKRMVAAWNMATAGAGDTDTTQTQGINHGFSIISRVISFAPPAYLKFCTLTARKPTNGNLGELLVRKQSLETVLSLAQMSGVRCDAYEQALQLQGPLPDYQESGFAIVSDDSTDPYFAINPTVLRDLAADFTTSNPSGEPPGQCPGQAIIRAGWLKAVQYCTGNSDHFTADLQ